MILSNQCIYRTINAQDLEIDPFDYRRVQPASYDLTLDPTFIVDDKRVEKTRAFWLWPHQFALGSTRERLRLPAGIMGIVSGCSTEGRKGLIVEMAGVIDPGFEGQVTLEFFNAGKGPILLEPGMRIAQIVFYRLCHPADPPYAGRYQGQEGVNGPRPLDHQ